MSASNSRFTSFVLKHYQLNDLIKAYLFSRFGYTGEFHIDPKYIVIDVHFQDTSLTLNWFLVHYNIEDIHNLSSSQFEHLEFF